MEIQDQHDLGFIELLDTVLELDLEPVGTPNPTNPNVITPPDADLLQAWK